MADFKIIKTYQLKDEICWEYSCSLFFNNKLINYFTITNHFQKKYERISKEKVLELLGNLNCKKLTRDLCYPNKEVFIWDTEDYLDKNYP